MGVFDKQGEAMKRICQWLLAVTFLLTFTGTKVIAGETTVGAEVHAHWMLHLNDQDLGKNFNYFNVHRGWLTVDHTFSEKYSANLIIEANNTGYSASNGWDTHLRSAYFQVNDVLPYSNVRFGMHGLLWMDKVESVWGLRYVDEVSLHKLGYLPRADFGASLIGNCPGGFGVLALQVLNGGGYTQTELNKHKNFALYGEFHPFPKNADWSEVAILGQYYMGYPNVSSVGSGFSDNTMMDRMQGAFIIKYRKWLTFYSEYFVTKDDADATNNTNDEFVLEANGFTVFGRLYVATSEKWLSRVSAFAKYERVDKNKNASSSLERDNGDARFLIAGLAYEPVDNIEMAILLRRDTISELVNNVRIEENEANSLMFTMKAYIK